MKKLLVVDDVELNRELLEDILSVNYKIETACNGQEALDKIQKNEERDMFYDLILLDLQMPVVDGFGVLNYMREHDLLDKSPVIIISAAYDSEGRCFDYNVSDFIAKPFREKIILKRVENVLVLKEYQKFLENKVNRQDYELEKQNQKLKEQAALLEKKNATIINVLGDMVESRSLESGTHVKRVCGFTQLLGVQYMKDYPEAKLTEEQVDVIAKAAALHDVGKIYIPDSILLKPGKLTDEEFEIMKTHTLKGCEVLNKIQVNEIWDADYQKVSYEITRYHHERFDGKGYPEKLSGDEIPLSAQLVAIADVYDALITDRVYKKAFSKETAFEMITTGKCGTFNPKTLESFTRARTAFEELADKLTK